MRDVIVAGGSAGAIEPLRTIVGGLPGSFPASMAVVIHVPAAGSVLDSILSKSGPLPAVHPEDGERIAKGKIYVAPPDHHLLFEKDRLKVLRGPRENLHRPAIDPLFRSAAQIYGPRVVAIQLSGTGDDGTAGLVAVKAAGGTTIVQDPAEAVFPSMLLSALEHLQPDHILPAADIPPLLLALVEKESPARVSAMTGEREPTAEIDLTEARRGPEEKLPASPYGCPECGGALWEEHEGDFLRYRCRVGHAYSHDELLSQKNGDVEKALWMALRALEEKRSLIGKLREHALRSGLQRAAQRFEARGNELSQPLMTLHALLEDDALFGLPTPGREGTTG